MSERGGPTVLIAVGDELLSGHTLDTNSNLLAKALFAAGHPVRRVEVVGDDSDAIIAAVRRAQTEAGVSRIVVSGGIGPTPDDRTFGAVARALDRPLELNPVAFAHIETLVRRMHEAGWVDTDTVSEANRRSALVPAGSTVLPNRRGMAPGLAIELGERTLFVLPGIPREFSTMVEEELIPHYFQDGAKPHVTEVRYTSVPEAELAGPLGTLEGEFPDVIAGSYPHIERRELVIRLRGLNEDRVAAAAARLRELRSDEEPPGGIERR